MSGPNSLPQCQRIRRFGVLLISVAALAATVAAAHAETPARQRAINTLLGCLNDPIKREPGYVIDEQHFRYGFEDIQLTDADRMNNVTYRAKLYVSYPYHGPDSGWVQFKLYSPVEVTENGRNVVFDNIGSLSGLVLGTFECHSS